MLILCITYSGDLFIYFVYDVKVNVDIIFYRLFVEWSVLSLYEC